MTHTVIGIFEDWDEAKEAVGKLQAAGFSNNDIDLSKRKSNQAVEKDEYHEEKTGENGLTRFFRRLFGQDDNDAEKYSRVAYDMGTVVSVYTNSEVEANQAADILDDNGAIDVDDRARNFGHDWQRIDQPANAIKKEYPNTTDAGHPDKTTPNMVQESTSTGERTSPGTGVEETGASRSKSRIIPWKGEASAQLREDRLTETKFW